MKFNLTGTPAWISGFDEFLGEPEKRDPHSTKFDYSFTSDLDAKEATVNVQPFRNSQAR